MTAHRARSRPRAPSLERSEADGRCRRVRQDVRGGRHHRGRDRHPTPRSTGRAGRRRGCRRGAGRRLCGPAPTPSSADHDEHHQGADDHDDEAAADHDDGAADHHHDDAAAALRGRGDAVAPRPAPHLRPDRRGDGRAALVGHGQVDRHPARLVEDRRERPRPVPDVLPACRPDRRSDPGRRRAVDDPLRHGRGGGRAGGVGEAPALRAALRLLDQPPQHRHQPRPEHGLQAERRPRRRPHPRHGALLRHARGLGQVAGDAHVPRPGVVAGRRRPSADRELRP